MQKGLQLRLIIRLILIKSSILVDEISLEKNKLLEIQDLYKAYICCIVVLNYSLFVILHNVENRIIMDIKINNTSKENYLDNV